MSDRSRPKQNVKRFLRPPMADPAFVIAVATAGLKVWEPSRPQVLSEPARSKPLLCDRRSSGTRSRNCPRRGCLPPGLWARSAAGAAGPLCQPAAARCGPAPRRRSTGPPMRSSRLRTTPTTLRTRTNVRPHESCEAAHGATPRTDGSTPALSLQAGCRIGGHRACAFSWCCPCTRVRKCVGRGRAAGHCHEPMSAFLPSPPITPSAPKL